MADDLLSLIDSTSERVQRESLEFQSDIARGLMDASGGEITGFEVTRTDDDARGVHQTETVFERATRNLNLVADVNPEQEAAAIRTSRERGIPLPLARALDNREMKKPDLQSLAPETLAFFGDDPSNAAVAKDDVEGIDNIVAAAQCAAMSPEERRDGLLDGIRRNGYSASQLADLKAAGYSPLPDDPTGAGGVFSVDSMKSLNATTKWPVLESWYSGPGEVEQSKLEKEAAERFDKVFRHGFDNVRGSAWLVNATPETAANYIQTLDEEIVTMQGLYALYGDGWKELNDDDLASAIGEVGKTFGFDSSRVSPARLRPAGVGWETDWEQVLNVFGIIDAYEHRTKLSQRELDEVHRDPLAFSHGDRVELVDELEEQARALRGMTRWNQSVESLLASIRFMAEFAATGGVSAAPSAMKAVLSGGWLRGLPRFIGLLLKGEARRLPAYLPRLGGETVEETRARVSQTIQDGAVLPGMTEAQTSEIANVFFNKVLNTYIENVSEGVGGSLPGTGKVLRPLMNAVPQRLKNAAFAQAAKRVLGDVATSKGAKVANMVYERTMFNGLLGEYAEEKWGDAIRAVSTELAQSIGTPYGDLGQDSVFGSLEDELHLMGTLAVTGAVLQSVRIPTAVGDIRRAVQFVDAHRAVHTAVEEAKTTQRSPETLEYLLQYYTRGANTAYLSPEGARTLFQSAPELMDRIGVSEDMIGEAELKERMIPVSMAKVHAHVSRAELDTLLVKLVPDPKHTLTMEDAAKVNLEEEAQKVAEETDRVRAETKAAYDEAIQKMMALNRPASEIRAVARLLSMANYFAAESNMSAADFIRGLDFQSMKFQEWLAQQSAREEVPLRQRALSQAIRQKFGSGATSLRQVAAGFKKIDFAPGTVNLDLGGGKFDEGTKYLAEKGVTNLVYDPVNRSSEENWKIYDAVRNGGVDTVTCNNVLNVIGEAEARDNVILQAAKALKPGGVAYFTVYEGDGSGKGRQSKSDSWQEHRKTKTYVGEVERHFGSVSLRNGVIEARDPITEGKTSVWFNEGLGSSPALLQVSPVWTGSAASYDAPSLQYIGTGEGAQAYGWGLYGSSSREVAEWYAQMDADRKKRPRLTLDGRVIGLSELSTPDEVEAGDMVLKFGKQSALDHIQYAYSGDPSAIKELTGLVRRMDRIPGFKPYYVGGYSYETVDEILRALQLESLFGKDARDVLRVSISTLADENGLSRGERISAVEKYGGKFGKRAAQLLRKYPDFRVNRPHNLYQQTFWPGKEENLLDWDKKVPKKQIQKIADQAVKEGLPFGYTENGKNFFNGSATSGELLYKDLAKPFNLGSPKAASEFLYRAGIDGVTFVGDSSGVRNYVAFSDQDIRVDEHIMYQAAAAAKSIGMTKGVPIFQDNIEATITSIGDAPFDPSAKGSAVNAMTGQKIDYNPRTYRHSRSNTDTLKLTNEIAPYLPDIIRNAIPTENEPAVGKETVQKAHRYFSAVEYDGNLLAVELTVLERKDGRFVLYDYRAYDSGKKIERSGNLLKGGRTLNPRPAVAAPTINIRSLLEEVKPEYYEHPEYFWQAVGDKFRTIRDALPEEAGETPLLSIPKNLPNRITALPEPVISSIKEAYGALPSSVTDAWGDSVYLKEDRRGDMRLVHYITSDTDTGGRGQGDLDPSRIPWLPRIAETVARAQVMLRDFRNRNRVYVRNYAEGLHLVVTSAEGKFIGQKEYDTSAITQFPEDNGQRSTRDRFTVEKERGGMLQSGVAAPSDGAAGSASLAESDSTDQMPGIAAPSGQAVGSGSLVEPDSASPKSNSTEMSDTSAITADSLTESDSTEPVADNNIYPTLNEIKSAIEQSRKIPRGATTFTDNWNAMVTLFEGEADASTLVHELGHYATEMMRHLVESGAAGERMQKDYATLMEWATRGTNDPVEQRERLARAFEAYCMEGKAPSIELEGAFATLRRLLLHVYNSVKALGVEISNDVRKVFDGMLATDATIRQESFLREAAMEIDKELLGLSQPEIRTFRELIAKSNDQAIRKLTAEKNAQLAKLRPQWRKEANELMDGEPVYNAWRAIEKEGGIDYVALEEICGEYMAGELRKKGLTTNPGRKSKAKIDKKTGEVIRPAGYYSAKSGKHPASFAFENGFATVEEMVDALFYAQSPQSFVSSYMADAEKRFNEAFDASEAALSVEASVEAMEKLGEILAVKGGKQGYRIRRALLRQQAREEIDAMSVGKVVSDKQLISDCRTNARKLTQAANKGDFITAFEEAKALRYNLEVLRLKGDAKQEVERVDRLLSRGRHAKKGTIYGDHQEALTDLSVRFGFTRTQPKRPLRHTVASVVKEYNEEAEANGEPGLELPAFLLSESGPYRGLSFAEFQQLGMLADFLYGEGKALVSARETAFREQVKAALDGSIAELEVQPHKYTKSDNLFVHGYRSLIQQGTKLRNIIGMAAKWKKDSALQKLYDEMVFAASEQTQLMTDPARTATAALTALYKSTRELPLDTIRDIPFPADVIAEGYRKWDAEKVVAACLNMGNAKNRQRLIDGYEWGENGETYCNRIAALLTAEDWANVQKIWDAINGNLAQRVAQTYREEYHHDLVEEPALPFQVTTADGQTIDVAGGYYPLDYLYHKNTIVRNREESQSNYNPPAFRRASFTFERTEKLSDPLRLSLNLVYEHLFDAAHYVSHRAVMRKVLRVVNDTTFRKHFEQTQGFERYQALKALVNNVAAPGAALKGEVSQFEEWGRSALTALSLWASPSVMAMQVAGVTFGLDELGSYYFSALRDIAENPMEAYRFVMSHSGMMRDRVNLKDLDLKTRANLFRENVVERTRREITEIGYAPMRYIDLGVATPIWMAAYHQAVDRGMDMPHAVAAADEFVAKTQGATRPIDMSPIQLKAWGRGFAVFFSAVSAGATMGTKTLSRIKTGAATPTAAVAAVAANILAPYFLSSLVRAIVTGPGGDDDDPDRMMRAFFKELVTQPFGGIPFVRDVADTAAMAVFNKHGYSTRVFFENSSLRGPNEIAVAAYEGIAAAFDENPDRAIYKLAEAMGMLFRVPVVGAYERIRRILTGWIDDPDFMPDFDRETRKRRR